MDNTVSEDEKDDEEIDGDIYAIYNEDEQNKKGS
jgi:hypothetical protein